MLEESIKKILIFKNTKFISGLPNIYFLFKKKSVLVWDFFLAVLAAFFVF